MKCNANAENFVRENALCRLEIPNSRIKDKLSLKM